MKSVLRPTTQPSAGLRSRRPATLRQVRVLDTADQFVVMSMAGSVSIEAAPQTRAGECKVADAIENLVADAFIRPPE